MVLQEGQVGQCAIPKSEEGSIPSLRNHCHNPWRPMVKQINEFIELMVKMCCGKEQRMGIGTRHASRQKSARSQMWLFQFDARFYLMFERNWLKSSISHSFDHERTQGEGHLHRYKPFQAFTNHCSQRYPTGWREMDIPVLCWGLQSFLAAGADCSSVCLLFWGRT